MMELKQNNQFKNENEEHNQSASIEFNKSKNQEKNTNLLNAIIREIKKENTRTIIFNFLIWFIFISFLGFSGLIALNHWKNLDIAFLEGISDLGLWFLLLVIFIPGFILLLTMVVYSQLNKYSFDQEKKYHFKYRDEIDLKRVPNFIINKYKKISGVMIVINWISFTSYFFGGLCLVFFFVFRNKTNFIIDDIEIKLSNNKSFPNYQEQIIGTLVYLGLIFILQIIVVNLCVRSKSRLTALFDLKNRINFEEIERYKKRVNIFCFCILLIPLFVVILVYLFVKKLRIKSI